MVSPKSPFHGVADVISAARMKPREISYGSSGPGTGSHLAGALLGAEAGWSCSMCPIAAPARSTPI
ncbi:tripartite tricarboxylate transporter substrate-binding protein [Siccirubricoccus deserti]